MQKWILEHPAIQDTTIYVPKEGPELTERTRRTYIEIAKAQQYFQRNPIKFVEIFFGFYLLDFQKLLFMMAWITPNVLCNCTRGAGKALDIHTPIYTPHGFRKLKYLKEGDLIYNDKGEMVSIVSIGRDIEDQAYKLTFEDESSIIAHSQHEWKVYVDGIPRLLETKDLLDCGSDLQVDLHKPLEFLDCPKPELDPYIYGLLIGNRERRLNGILIDKEDVEPIRNYCIEHDFIEFSVREHDKIRLYLYDSNGIPMDQRVESIPFSDYLKMSIEDRLALFGGLIDGANKAGEIRIAKKDKDLLFCINELLSNLGVKHSVTESETDYHFFYHIYNGQYPGKTGRLYACFGEDDPEIHRQKIVSIKPCGTRVMRCIQIADTNGLFLAGNGLIPTHNSTIISILLMAKGMLFNNYWSYIASGSGNQAQQTFRTLEQLANDNIETFMNSSGYIFKNELDKPQGGTDGFTHSPTGHKFELYNGSSVKTLNSSVDKNRGNRGNVIFDECGWLSANMINVYRAYAVVNKDLKTGVDASGRQVDAIYSKAIPEDLPYQVFYISSASDEESEYYHIYREFAKRMFMGDKDYFVYQVDCEICFAPTLDGKPTKPLLSPEFIENQLKTNPEKAKREYYCQFSTDAGEEAIIRRSVITRNEVVRRPLLNNDTGQKKFVIAYDPARMTDNSVIAVGEIIQENKQYKMKLVNCLSLMDYTKKKTTPKTIEEQVSILRQVILDYNKGGNKQYSNIIGIYMDGGSGGQGQAISDLLMKDWKDKDGNTHFGLVDLDHEPNGKRFNPNVITDKFHYMEPTKYKSLIYDALIDMVHSDLIEFTAEYENRGYLIDFDKNGNAKQLTLSKEEESALINFDLMKDQIVNIQRIKGSSGKDRFELAPDKARRMHDDHAYVAALLGYALYDLRRDEDRKKKDSHTDLIDLLAGSMHEATRQVGF